MQNPGFEVNEGYAGHEADVYREDGRLITGLAERGEDNPPSGWKLWYIWEQAPPEWDPGNLTGHAQPESRYAEHQERIHTGKSGGLMFSFYRIHQGGYYQQVPAQNGEERSFTIFDHAWSSNADDPSFSNGAGTDPYYSLYKNVPEGWLKNYWTQVGIDPAGGTSPFSPNVVWGEKATSYNAYHKLPEATAIATGDTITLFTRHGFIWPLKHCDSYIDSAQVSMAEVPVEEEDPVAVDYKFPVVKQGSKLTEHANTESGTYDILTHLVANGYTQPYVKVVASKPADLLAVRNLKKISPDTEFIGRVITGNDGFNPQSWQPGMSADKYMEQFIGWAKKYPEVKYWELWNEEDPPDHVPMAEFAVDCMHIAEDNGFKLAVMSWSSGVPEESDILAIYDDTTFFERIKAGGHILSIHAYCRTSNPASIRDHLLRMVHILYKHLEEWDLVVPSFFSEYSVDESAAGVGVEDWSVHDLMAEYGRVDDILAQYYYFIGVAVYWFGMSGSYNHDKMWLEFADLILSKRNRQNALAPESEQAKAGYDRTVMVVDYDRITSPETRHKFYAEACDRGIYVGPSHDEAANRPSNATRNTVELVGFSAVDAEYVKFYQDRDPQVHLVFRTQEEPVGLEVEYVVDNLPVNPDSPWYPWNKRQLSEITHLFVHHSAGPLSSDFADVVSIADYHTRAVGKNRPGICYAYVIGEDGHVWQTSSLEDVVFGQGSTSYPGDENRWGLAVCLLGNFTNGNQPTQAQIDSLDLLISATENLLGKELLVWGHKDVAATACPGDWWPLNGWGRYDEEENTVVRGVHWAPIKSGPADIASHISRMCDHNLTYVKLLYDGQGSMLRFAEALVLAGKIPVIRLFSTRVGRNTALEHARSMINVGVEYFEIMNEPNIEWPNLSWQNPDNVRFVTEAWLLDARLIVSWGGKVALPAMAPTDRGSINTHMSGPKWISKITELLAQEHYSEIVGWLEFGSLWTAVHIAPFDKPFDFNPMQPGHVDDFCLRYFEWVRALVLRRFGIAPLLMATEAGPYSPSHTRDLTFPVSLDGYVLSRGGTKLYNLETWGDYMRLVFKWMEDNNGITLMPWTFTDEDVADARWIGCGWYDKDGNRRMK